MYIRLNFILIFVFYLLNKLFMLKIGYMYKFYEFNIDEAQKYFIYSIIYYWSGLWMSKFNFLYVKFIGYIRVTIGLLQIVAFL